MSSGRLLWQATADNDELADITAGDLVWTVDGENTIRAYPLAGCGAPTCAPISSYTSPTVSGIGGLLVTQGHLAYWGLSGLRVRSV